MRAVPSSETPAKRPIQCAISHGSYQECADIPFDLDYENIGAGCAKLACTLPPVPIGPAVAAIFPPIVTFPPRENALTASSLFKTTTKSVMSAPIWRPHPRPPVAMQDGADQEPSGSRAITSPEPAFPLNTNPALRTWKMARPEFDAMLECQWSCMSWSGS